MTLLYAARDETQNNAVVLKTWLLGKLRARALVQARDAAPGRGKKAKAAKG